MATPTELLNVAFERAYGHLSAPLIANAEIVTRIEMVCRDIRNRACVRFVLACCLAKAHRPEIDIRKPYTEIHEANAYSGRTYDESYVTAFVMEHQLPCNTTTAFLTPAFRNRNVTLTPDTEMVGRPASLYQSALQLLTDIQEARVTADEVLAETVRWLLLIRDEKRLRIQTLLADLSVTDGTTPLSAEAIVGLIEQHLKIPGSSRLPVLVVAAAYSAASTHLGERALLLQSHNAADKQTGLLGDVEITLIGSDNVITSYEMKTRHITRNDIDQALQKIGRARNKIDNYIFITTDIIDEAVREYAFSLYDHSGGIEFVILDCIGFLRHFLHLFHRLRGEFLEAYQRLLLVEPDSAVSQPLKEAFLALRQAVETGTNSDGEDKRG